MEVAAAAMGVEIFGPQGMEELTSQLQGMMKNFGGDKKQSRKLPIKEALKVLTEEESRQVGE